MNVFPTFKTWSKSLKSGILSFKCRESGFTLVEIMIVVGLMGLVMGGAISVYLLCQRFWRAATMDMLVARETSLALNRIVYGVGTNFGLRAASSVVLYTNCWGYRAPGATNYPLPASSTSHYVVVGGGGTPDGSWFLMTSNMISGARWLEYNRKASNIVLRQELTNCASRLAIADYIASAVVTTNARGVFVDIVASNRHGMISATNRSSTYISFRN